MIGYAKKIEKIIRESAFDKKKKKSGLKFKPGLALIRIGTTGPRLVQGQAALKFLLPRQLHGCLINFHFFSKI